MTSQNTNLCLCGTQQPYAKCCEPLHSGLKHADSPEQLMRTRFTAYALKNARYIYETYANSKKKDNPIKEIKDFANSCRFVKLEVLSTELNEETQEGTVEFKATYFYQNLYCVLHELSQFIKEDEQWRYLDGTIYPIVDSKVGRNDDCPCGSNKKYKKCHSL